MPKVRKSPQKPGGRPARSDAEWWNADRNSAFEAIRRGESFAGVNPRTLRRWQESPLWQARLAERDAAAAAAATKAEIEPLERLRAYLDGAVDAVGKMATGKLDPCKTRLSAAIAILDRFRVQVRDDSGRDVAERVIRALNAQAEFERAKALTLDAMRGRA